MLFPPNRPLRWALPGLLLLGFIGLSWLLPGWALLPENWTVDLRFQLRGPRPFHQPIVIIALDETSFKLLSISEQGQNIRTWPRANWAELITAITAGRPRLVGLDVAFDTPGWDPGGDEALAQALAQAGNVLLIAHAQPGQLAGIETGSLDNYSFSGYSPPLPALAQAAAATGVAIFVVDSGGTVRRAPLLWAVADQVMPTFALAAAVLVQGQPVDVPRQDLDADLAVAINFRGSEGMAETTNLKIISLLDVWQHKTPPETFRDAIVLVGYTTDIEQDRHFTPFSSNKRTSGVVIQANLIDNLLSQDWLHRPAHWLLPLLVLICGLAGLGAAALPRPLVGLLSLLGGCGLYSLLAQILFNQQNFLLPVAAPLLAALLTGGAAITERVVFSEQDKRRMRQRFAGMMTPERLQAVMENWDSLRDFTRPPKNAAVLFADIRGFTHTTEKLMALNRTAEMNAFLSAYLDAMAAAVLPEGGVIYRMFGDGLLIMFGMPEPIADESLHAVRAAVRMSLAAQQLQSAWPLRDEPDPAERCLGMGIGIHHGPMVDALVGRGRQMDYAIIGDAANTAARIEAYCKEAMLIPRPPGGEVPPNVTILISQELYAQVKAHILADLSIPAFAARGKSEPVQVVRVLGLHADT